MLKTKYLVIFLAFLVLGMTVAVAADVDDSTSTTKKVTKDTTKIVKNTAVTKKATKTTDKKTTKAKENTKTKNTTEKTITKNTQTKSVKRGEIREVNNTSFDQLFTVNGLGSIVNPGDTLNFVDNITRNGSYVVDKSVTIQGNGNRIELNTVSGNYSGTESGNSFNITGSYINITNLKFYNSQVFVKTADHVIMDNINVTVKNQRIGSGVGVTSIRENSSYITVKNSFFNTVNNEGSSTLVLASADYCTVDNNTIIGEGYVGNLMYLTTYNIPGVNYTDVNVNTFNNITNNRISAINLTGGVCVGVVVSGHNNTFEGNNVSVPSAFNGQWISPFANLTGDFNDTYEGNSYIANDVNGSFTGTKNSTITGNTFHGTVSLPERCIFKNNNAENSTVTVTGKNCDLCNNTVNTIVLNKAATNTSICYDMWGVTIVNNYNLTINWYLHPSSLTLTKKLSRSLKNDGEPNVIDITEENFNTYFKNNKFNMMQLGITADTVFNLKYIPSNQEKLTFVTGTPMSQNPIKVTFVGINNLTLDNVYFDVQGPNAVFKDINFIYNGSCLGNRINLMWADPFQNNPYPIIFDNVTVNFNGEYVLNDDPAISPVISSVSANSMVIINNSEINADVPATPGGYTVISGNGISLINSNITIKEKYAVDDTSSLNVLGLRTVTDFPILIDNNNITVLAESDAFAIKLKGDKNNITNNNITIYSDNLANAIDVSGEENIIKDNIVSENVATGFTVISSKTANINEETVITIILKTKKGKLVIAGEDITINVGEESETVTTDEFGVVVYKFTPTTSGELTVNITHKQNGKYLESNETLNIFVNEDKDAIIEELNKTIASQEEDIDDLNKIIEEQDNEIESLTNTTQALNNTVAQLEQDIKDVQKQLANNNNTNTNGTSSGNGTSNTNTTSPTKTSVTIKLNPTTIYTGSKTKITATLKDANGKAVANQKITLKVGTKTYTVKTNKKGVATKTVKVTKTGKNKVTATFKATSKYAKATKSATVTVKAKQATKITVSKLSYKNKKITIKATIKAGKKALTQNTKLTIKVDGKTLTSKKISKKGKISLTLKKALKNGSHKVQIISKATSMYKQSKVTKTLKV